MSLTAGTPLAPPLGTPRLGDWRQGLTAICIVTLVVFAGELFGLGVFEGGARLGLDEQLLRFRVLHPGIVAVYQLALLLALMSWLEGRNKYAALGMARTGLRLWHWAAILVGLYALKAAATVGFLALSGSPMAGGESGGTPAALVPFGMLMKSSLWPFMLGAGIMAAVVEELLYRGYLSRTLEGTRLGFWGGALVASLIWAALHIYYPLPIQASLVVVGIALSWLRAWCGSIWPGMAWHVLNNTAALLALKAMA